MPIMNAISHSRFPAWTGRRPWVGSTSTYALNHGSWPGRTGRAPPRPAESPPQLGHLVEPAQLVRVAHRVHAGDPAVLDDEGDRRVELAARVDPRGDRAVDQQCGDLHVRRELREVGERRSHLLPTHDW